MIRQCEKCGVIRQVVDLTPEQYADFYRDEYHDKHQSEIGCQAYKDRYDHDVVVAQSRLEHYALTSGSLLIDIGSGNNAFVDTANRQGIQAYGVELGKHSAQCFRTYNKNLFDIHFPNDYADVITMHDVLEHVVDPVSYLNESRRILKDGGKLIIDFPKYFVEEGLHHWRPIQHLWYFRPSELISLLNSCGFRVTQCYSPIASKLVFIAEKIPVKHTEILVIPGMGDIYWVAVKLQDMALKKGWSNPRLHIWDFDGRPRSEDYIRRIPFVSWGGYWEEKKLRQPEFNQVYLTGEQWLLEPYDKFDAFICTNGILRVGRTLDEPRDGTDQFDTNWYFPMFESWDEAERARQYRQAYGDFILTHFSNFGMFKFWAKELPASKTYGILSEFHKQTGIRFVLTGKQWDAQYNQQLMSMDKGGKHLINLVDQTSILDLYALMRSSRGMFGWCGGNTIKAVYFKKPCLMFWNRYFRQERFFVNCVPPDSVGKWYLPLKTHDFSLDQVKQWMHSQFGGLQ